eukprot:480925-Amphidinium_carterae.1
MTSWDAGSFSDYVGTGWRRRRSAKKECRFHLILLLVKCQARGCSLLQGSRHLTLTWPVDEASRDGSAELTCDAMACTACTPQSAMPWLRAAAIHARLFQLEVSGPDVVVQLAQHQHHLNQAGSNKNKCCKARKQPL